MSSLVWHIGDIIPVLGPAAAASTFFPRLVNSCPVLLTLGPKVTVRCPVGQVQRQSLILLQQRVELTVWSLLSVLFHVPGVSLFPGYGMIVSFCDPSSSFMRGVIPHNVLFRQNFRQSLQKSFSP